MLAFSSINYLAMVIGKIVGLITALDKAGILVKGKGSHLPPNYDIIKKNMQDLLVGAVDIER